jgi:hypothetical protein
MRGALAQIGGVWMHPPVSRLHLLIIAVDSPWMVSIAHNPSPNSILVLMVINLRNVTNQARRAAKYLVFRIVGRNHAAKRKCCSGDGIH